MKPAWILVSALTLTMLGDTAIAQLSEPGEIINHRFGIKDWDSRAYVFTIGEVQNNSDATLDDIVVEARYFDAQGELIDVTVERLYSVSVPPFETVAFRLESLALAANGDYASHAVRLVSADENRPCSRAPAAPTSSSADTIKRLLISAFPILLLLVVWGYFLRRYSGKDSPQNRSVDLIARQNEMIDKQSAAVERIADALDDGEDRGQ